MDGGFIITDDIVIDYRKPDKDHALHFLTHIDLRPDGTLKSLSEYISPTAKKILTSEYNARLIKANFNVKNCEGYKPNTNIKFIFNHKKYICTLIESKYSVGSISVLIWGPFGTCLYTGNFCYYPEYLNLYYFSLVVKRKKLLNTLYLDATYYKQESEFGGVQDNLETVITIIKSSPSKKIYIHTENHNLDPIIADLASQLEENVYVDPSRMQTMKLLGYDKYFTTDITRTRIIVSIGDLPKRGSQEILINFKRHSEPSVEFEPFSFDETTNIYSFHFYCHSNHKECCHLINILKPEKLILINSSSIDRSKITVAPMLNSLGKNEIFSISSSFESIPFNFYSNPFQTDLKECTVKKGNFPFVKKENSFSLNKFERQSMQKKREFNKPAFYSRINSSEDNRNSAFKINQKIITKPNTCPPNDYQRIKINELLNAASFSLNCQNSLNIFDNSNLVGATEPSSIKTYSNNQDKTFSIFTNKISSGEHNLVKSSTLCKSPQKSLKIHKVSEINLLSASKNIVLASKETIEPEKELNVNIISPEVIDNESGVQKDVEHCINKDSSLLLLTKVLEKPKSIFLSKPKINSPCVDNLKQTYINDSFKIDKSALPSESSKRRIDNSQENIKKPLWSDSPLYIYKDKRIIPVEHSSHVSVIRATESTNLKSILETQMRESPDTINKTVRIYQTLVKPMENVEEISYPKGIAAFSIKKNKSSNGNTLSDLILKNSNTNRIPIDVSSISKKVDNTIAKNHSEATTNPQNKSNNPAEIPTSSPEIKTSSPEMRPNSPEITNKCPEISTHCSEINKEGREKRSSLKEIDLPKETGGNSCCNQDLATISMNSVEVGMLEDSSASLKKQIESNEKTINHDKKINHNTTIIDDKAIDIDKTINQLKLIEETSESPVEGSQNKLISDSFENIPSQSSTDSLKKNISSSTQASASNLSESITEVNPNLKLRYSKNVDSSHVSQDCDNCEEPLQLRKIIEHDEQSKTSLHSNENSDFCRNRKRKLNSNKSDFHKRKIFLRSSEVDDNSSLSEYSDSRSCGLLTPLPDNLQATQNVDDLLQKKFGIKPCRVILNRNDITRRHFFSPNHGAYVPKFYGFTSKDMRQLRKHHYFLRIYHKYINK